MLRNSALSAVVACAVVAVVAVGGAAPSRAQEKKSRRTTAEAMKAKGLELKKFVEIDVDGDGRKELFGAGSGEKGLRLALIGEDKDGAVVLDVMPWAGGKEIAKLEPLALAPPAESFEVLFEVYDETPDEKVKRVRIYGFKEGRLKEIFTNVLNRSKNTADREPWESDKSIIAYGDARGGWYFDDIEGDGVGEVLVRRKPQILTIAGEGDDVVKLMTGVREQVWRWDEANWLYKESGERLNDFLPALEIAKVTASSAWIEPRELAELKAEALSKALMKEGGATDGSATDSSGASAGGVKEGKEGSPGGDLELGLEDLEKPTSPGPVKKGEKPKKPTGGKKGEKPKKEAKPEEPEVEIDRTAYMLRGADKNLTTAWIEDASDDGKGEWLELELAEESAIHMVRIVAGCVESAQAFKSHNVPETFKVQIDGGSEAVVNRREPGKFDAPSVAFSDGLFKAKDRPWMRTTLVFFDGKTEAKKVRVILEKAIKQGKSNQTCISEVSVH